MNEYQNRTDQLKKDLERLHRDLESAQDYLHYLQGRKESREFYYYCLNYAVANVRARIQSIITEEIDKALAKVEEFDNPVYRGKLFLVFEDQDILTATLEGSRPMVLLDMNTKAGTLEDYANGITYAREVIESSQDRKRKYNPITASNYWKNFIYAGKGMDYGTTIALRVQGFHALAPWWALIDQGVPQQLSSDRGGFAYPTSSATRFVSIIERSIQYLVEGAYENSVESETQLINNSIERELNTIGTLYDQIRVTTDQIMSDSLAWSPAEQILEEKISTHKIGLEKADPKKIESLIQAIINQEPVPDRIRLGGGVRVRTIELQRQIHEALGK